MPLDLWYLFPVSMLIAAVAMASGITGSTFFTPIFIMGLGLRPDIAITGGLIINVFGVGSGILAYRRQGLIDFRLGLALLMVTVPAALLGVFLMDYFPADYLKLILGMGLVSVAFGFLRAPSPGDVKLLEEVIHRENPPDRARTCLRTRAGENICYTVCNRTEGRLISALGALFMGLVSTGLGELNGYFLLQRCRVPGRVAAGTNVFIIAVTALAASLAHGLRIRLSGGGVPGELGGLLLFAVPGVILGAQLGPSIAQRVPPKAMAISMAVLFIIIACLMSGNALGVI